ncbi:MAG TPA: response regulator transcription factor [Bryobacteraceae bacterium]|nr:response regulator transcription factor [Bryobacteraceae bacterium]
MPKILIVEDEQHLADGLRFNLDLEGHEATVVDNGEDALERLLGGPNHFDLVLLDVMLPGMSGFEVASLLRQRGVFLPIIMLTARGRSEDVLKGFESGSDDYLSKPFELAILLARVRGLLRRSDWVKTATAADQFVLGAKTIDFRTQEIRVRGRVYPLTLMETNLLRYLVQRKGEVIARKDLLEAVWGLREDTDTRAVDNFIVRLRRYLEDEPSRPQHLLTVRGVGYRFVAGSEIGSGK